MVSKKRGYLMRLYRVILPVSNIEKAARFYEGLFGIHGTRVSAGRHYFDCEGTILACYDARADGDESDGRPNPDHLYFAVDDLERVYRLAQTVGASLLEEELPGVGPLGEIATRPWGERSFYAADPFGNKLCFVDRSSVFTGK